MAGDGWTFENPDGTEGGIGDDVLLYGVAYTLETAYELFEVTGVVDLPAAVEDGERAAAETLAEAALAVAHDQQAADAFGFTAGIQFPNPVGRSSAVERVHVFHGFEPEVCACRPGEIQRVQQAFAERAVK